MGRRGADLESADGPACPAVDRTVVQVLLDDFGTERAQEICHVFVRDGWERLDALQAALDRDDADAAARAAHGLKSGSGFVGATEILRLCAEIERTARAGDLRFAHSCLPDLRTGLAYAADELVRIVGPAAPPS